MIRSDLRRDEEAVSAAVATVLLFGGVITIIGLMLLSMMPVIQELEGSVKRNDMQAQMTVFDHEVTAISESGLPGDSSEVELIPVDGELRWDRLRGGMWYSASWYEDTSFRIKGALDLDDQIEIRHPESNIEAVCYEDMRLGPDRPYIFTPNNLAETVLLTPYHGLTIPLGPVDLEQDGIEYKLSVGEVIELDADSTIYSSHDLIAIQTVGEGGTTLVPPTQANPSTGKGQHWAIPLPEGETTVEVFTDGDLMVQWTDGTEHGSDVMLQGQGVRLGNSWTKTFNLSEASLVEVITDIDSHLMIMRGETGRTTLLGDDGSYLSRSFVSPYSEGGMTVINPQSDAVTVTWRNGGVSVPGGQIVNVSWPPNGMEDSTLIESESDVVIEWYHGNHSLLQIPASDTGQFTGSTFMAGGADSHTLQNMTEYGYASMTANSGQHGMMMMEHDGAKRCITIDVTASGWVSTSLPWDSMRGQPDGEILSAWREGSHPASIEITLIGAYEDSTHSVLATAWAFQISRLTYEFDTSITGLEVAWSAGALVTNHPEMQAAVLSGPSDRDGPGARFSATVPSLHPTMTSTVGTGAMTLSVDLQMRESLASTEAYEVRRSWIGPYGEAIAAWSSSSLSSSEDWIVNPGRLDLLNDYTGWVPIPSHGPSEAIWHSNGGPIQFNLQVSSIDVHVEASR